MSKPGFGGFCRDKSVTAPREVCQAKGKVKGLGNRISSRRGLEADTGFSQAAPAALAQVQKACRFKGKLQLQPPSSAPQLHQPAFCRCQVWNSGPVGSHPAPFNQPERLRSDYGCPGLGYGLPKVGGLPWYAGGLGLGLGTGPETGWVRGQLWAIGNTELWRHETKRDWGGSTIVEAQASGPSESFSRGEAQQDARLRPLKTTRQEASDNIACAHPKGPELAMKNLHKGFWP